MPEAEVAAIKIKSVKPDRAGKEDLVVTYKSSDSANLYNFTMPAETATKSKIEQAIKDHYAKNKIELPQKFKL